jgi:hypothetical protein
MTTQKEVMKEVYDAAVLTAGAIAISFASKKLTKENLGVPTTVMGTSKLALAFGLSAVGVKRLEAKKMLPENPFKKD